jgi:DNA-binding transcriptional LysR family regulator
VDIRLLEYFVAVVDHGGVTKAAHALYIAQPSLSQAIRALEREVGVALFDRSNRRLELTPGGEAFLGQARRVLREAERARAKVGAVRDLESGRLTVAAVATLTVTPLSELVGRLHARHPGIQVTVQDPGSPAAVVEAVRQGQAELGVTPLVAAGHLVVEPLWTDRVMLAVAPGRAAGLPDPVPLDVLRSVPLVMEVDDRLGSIIADPELVEGIGRVVVRSVHRQAIWELVARGIGGTLVTERLARRVLSGVVLRPTEPTVRRPAGIVHRNAQLSPAASAFVEIARESAADLGAAVSA